jgi:cytoskeletal protein CcmA (bactofilin family)
VWRKEDANPQSSPEVSPSSMNSTTAGRTGAGAAGGGTVSPNAVACVSQGIKVKGEVTGAEDLFIDGTVDGTISLANSTVTIGPNATVKADIAARELVIRGRAQGKFSASARIEIWRSARVEAELKSERLSIEDGAELRGKVETGKVKSAAGAGITEQGKKTETGKPKEAGPTDAKTTSGAASAGAD